MTPEELHDDDQPIGRLLTRREMLGLLGGAGAVMIAGTGFTRFGLKSLTIASTPTLGSVVAQLPSCVVVPALTEGPYFVNVDLDRSDIRIEPTDDSIKEGARLRLQFRVSEVNATACKPLAGAQVDIWHCDALGVYSDVQDPRFDTSGQTWLRGYQVTDEDGIAEFITIYPGWYSGRTVHIHFKIRTDPEADQGYEFTSQLFFDEDMSDLVYQQKPYSSKGTQDVLNAQDGIFQSSEGLLTLDVVEDEEENEEGAGYLAIFDIGLDLSQPTQSNSGGGQPGNRPPRP